MPRLFIIADDLTGACDTGSCFAARGLKTLVVLDRNRAADLPPLNPDALVFSTESRYLPEAQAIRAVEDVAGRILDAPSPQARVYKKIDSTLRGHPGAELAALMDALQTSHAFAAPAFPAQGRSTVGGRQRVNGQPLEQTVFAHEAASSDLRAIFGRENLTVHVISLDDVRQGVGRVSQMLRRPGRVVWAADAESDADLAIAAQAVIQQDIQVLCGSAGLATALAAQLATAPPHPAREPLRPSCEPVLVVAGSQHPATARQVDAAQQYGMVVLRPAPAFLQPDGGDAVAQLTQQTATLLATGHHSILTTAGLPPSTLERGEIAARLGTIVAQALARAPCAGLVLTGGDVAATVCAALDVAALWLDGEVQPGIAIGRLADGRRPGLPVVTKAGGFGHGDALIAAVQALTRRAG